MGQDLLVCLYIPFCLSVCILVYWCVYRPERFGKIDLWIANLISVTTSDTSGLYDYLFIWLCLACITVKLYGTFSSFSTLFARICCNLKFNKQHKINSTVVILLKLNLWIDYVSANTSIANMCHWFIWFISIVYINAEKFYQKSTKTFWVSALFPGDLSCVTVVFFSK